MKGCNYIKKRIDEADKPDLLTFEVAEHIGRCDDCSSFAIERAGLRKLLASDVRVSAPMNFDAMLKTRLAEAKARGSSSWLRMPGYLRLGAATAGVAVLIFAAQYSGFFTGQPQRPNESQSAGAAPTPGSERVTPAVVPPTQRPAVAVIRQATPYTTARGKRSAVAGRVTPSDYFTAEDGGVVLVRGQNGGMDVPMPTVSVGAQPLLYVSAGQRPTRNVGTSF